MNHLHRILTSTPFWLVLLGTSSAFAALMQWWILAATYAAAFLMQACASPSAVRTFFRYRHRKGCGEQTFEVVRRECITVHHIHGPDWTLHIPVLDLRLRCPRCHRIHQIHSQGQSTLHRHFQ